MLGGLLFFPLSRHIGMLQSIQRLYLIKFEDNDDNIFKDRIIDKGDAKHKYFPELNDENLDANFPLHDDRDRVFLESIKSINFSRKQVCLLSLPKWILSSCCCCVNRRELKVV